MDIEQVIIEKGIARAMFVTAWADEMEESGRSFPPRSELMDIAPATPSSAIKEAYRLTGAVETVNKMDLIALIYKAAEADGKSFPDMPDDEQSEYARTFGHYLLMESLGHGVSWFDDHQKFDLELPYFENPLLGDPATMSAGSSLGMRT